MREILFRGKRVDNGKWVYGNLIDNECCKKPIIVEVDYLNEYGDCGEVSYEVDETTVGQFTGLTDKNGKKIFEGDILKIHRKSIYSTEEYFFYKVDWGKDWNGWALISIKSAQSRYLDNAYNGEVIGNIHDNPELLEGV